MHLRQTACNLIRCYVKSEVYLNHNNSAKINLILLDFYYYLLLDFLFKLLYTIRMQNIKNLIFIIYTL